MSEPLEVREPILGRLLTYSIFAVLAGVGFYMLFIYQPAESGNMFTPAQIAQVVKDYRARQTERLQKDLAEMQAMRDEMAAIRNTELNKAEVDDDFERVLDEPERVFREKASSTEQTPGELHEVFTAAQSVEQDMITMYREYMAARQVGMQPLLLYDEAYEGAATPRPQRPDLDIDALYRTITTTEPGGGLDAFKKEIKKSTIEMREMVENTKKLLEFTRKSQKKGSEGFDVDLSSDDIALMDYTGDTLMPHEIDQTHKADPGNYDAIPGRKITSTGEPRNLWMYVDSWYIIGPFPGDKRREKLDVQFGPEASVNLDDIFTGKDGKKITWEYKKVGYTKQGPGTKYAHWKIEPRDVARYGIYYAYTEVYSDADRTVEVAMGTDDYGKLWVNDELFWTSPKEHEPYHATEATHPLELKQGQNKILYRVENAGGTMGFSLMFLLLGYGE